MDENDNALKPPATLIDGCILASWVHYDPDQPRQVKSRSDILNAVFMRFSEGSYPRGTDTALATIKGDETWGDIYKEWFTNFNVGNGDYQVLIGTRLASLITDNIVMRDNFEDGFYKLVSPLSKQNVESVKNITLLVPQQGLKIPDLRLG